MRELTEIYERHFDNYMELLMAVETKCPNETRHETALRYIHQREEHKGCGKSNDK